jgi:hypothetical protein
MAQVWILVPLGAFLLGLAAFSLAYGLENLMAAKVNMQVGSLL